MFGAGSKLLRLFFTVPKRSFTPRSGITPHASGEDVKVAFRKKIDTSMYVLICGLTNVQTPQVETTQLSNLDSENGQPSFYTR